MKEKIYYCILLRLKIRKFVLCLDFELAGSLEMMENINGGVIIVCVFYLIVVCVFYLFTVL